MLLLVNDPCLANGAFYMKGWYKTPYYLSHVIC